MMKRITKILIRCQTFCFLIGFVITPSLLAQQTRYKDPVFSNVVEEKDLIYGQAVNTVTGETELLKLDLFQPEGDTLLKRPAIVLVHGGGFTGGDKARLAPLAAELSKCGYLTVTINYRLHNSYIGPEDTLKLIEATTMAYEDTKAAVRWLRANADQYRIDSERIALFGVSAGAFAVLHAAYEEPEGDSGNPGYSSEVQACAEISGGLIDDTVMEAGEPPLLIVHGTADTRVPYEQALELERWAREIGLPYEMHPIEGADHDLYPYTLQILRWTLDFYYKYLITGMPVPVELVAFSAKAHDGVVQLSWRTVTEKLNWGFYLDRRFETNEWQTIAFIPGYGTTVLPRDYEYVDRVSQSGTYSYRLRQVDYGGRVVQSASLSLFVSVPKGALLLPGYPNPFRRASETKPWFIVEVFLPEKASTKSVIKIYDALGRQVFSKQIFQPGWQQILWDGRNTQNVPCAPGIYIYELITPFGRQSRKVLLK